MRLFVALVPPDRVLDEVARAAGAVSDLAPTLRWARREQWHVTLAFLGEVDESKLPELTERLGRAAHRHGPMNLGFAGAGRFDGRVLWTAVRGDRDRLERLAQSIAAAARRSGIDVDERPFKPHLTLARSKVPTDLRPLVTALHDFESSAWTATDVHLVRSTLGAMPTYETLAQWPLASPSDREERGSGGDERRR